MSAERIARARRCLRDGSLVSAGDLEELLARSDRLDRVEAELASLRRKAAEDSAIAEFADSRFPGLGHRAQARRLLDLAAAERRELAAVRLPASERRLGERIKLGRIRNKHGR